MPHRPNEVIFSAKEFQFKPSRRKILTFDDVIVWNKYILFPRDNCYCNYNVNLNFLHSSKHSGNWQQEIHINIFSLQNQRNSYLVYCIFRKYSTLKTSKRRLIIRPFTLYFSLYFSLYRLSKEICVRGVELTWVVPPAFDKTCDDDSVAWENSRHLVSTGFPRQMTLSSYGVTNGSIAKYRLFSHATTVL